MGAESVELSRRLAVHAPHTAPGCLARIVLRQAGLDPDRDIHALVRPLGDYGMDLRWLHDGRIDAALGRRPLPDPHRRRGRRPPPHPPGRPRGPGRRTSPPARPAGDPQRTDTTLQHIQTFLGRHTADEARAHYETFIAPYFTTNGQADLNIGATAITTVTAELGVPATVTAAEFYRTATTTP